MNQPMRRGAYQKTLLNDLGGELFMSAEFGSNTGVGAEWYQSVDPAQRSSVRFSLRIGYWDCAAVVCGVGTVKQRTGQCLSCRWNAIEKGWSETAPPCLRRFQTKAAGYFSLSASWAGPSARAEGSRTPHRLLHQPA
jgi:hypothetical protein